jgi:DNA-binding NtrC family response regulator
MKANALLISKETADSNAIVAEAAARTDLFLLKATDAKRAFELLRTGLTEIDLVFIDVDPGIHSMAILEAITARESAPPVIVVTGFEQFEMAPIARRHGAAACIAKPFTADELVERIEDVRPATCASSSCSCDAWGHPYPSRLKHAARNWRNDCPSSAPRAISALGAVCSS